MRWADGLKRGSRPKHVWDLHTNACKKCGIPRQGVEEFLEQFYGCSVSRLKWRRVKESNP